MIQKQQKQSLNQLSQKCTQNQIQQLKELRTKTSDLTFLRGQIGIAEDNIKRQLNELAEQFNELYKTESEISQDMFKKYGKGEVDLEKGTFIKVE